MLSGVILLWFILTAAAVVFVAVDIRKTPESPVLKVAFVVITLFTGPIGAFLYALGCREPLSGLHERYTTARWRQTLGSTMHCVAGDGLGIVAGAVLAAGTRLPRLAEIALEYALGFGFGWTIFQALFMRRLSGSYRRALGSTALPELLSMNALMAAMVPVMMVLMPRVARGNDPTSAVFWFIMSMSLLAGFGATYPMNWWLVSHRLKHGMVTIRRPERAAPATPAREPVRRPSGAPAFVAMTAFSVALLAAGILVAMWLG